MGAPALGGSGAAIGTFVNRIVEFTILVILLYKKKYDFSINLFHNFKM